MKIRNSIMIMLSFLILGGMTIAHASSGGALLLGKSYGDWSAAWWQWQETNYPNLNFGTGIVNCTIGQKGPVWFLGGSAGTTEQRECSVETKKRLFFPLVNAVVTNEQDGFCPTSNCSVIEKREIADGFFSQDPTGLLGSEACLLQSTIDGVSTVFTVPTIRTQSPLFLYQGDSEAISDGFWVALNPLPAGTHVVSFTGGLCLVGQSTVSIFHVDVTYTLHVVP